MDKCNPSCGVRQCCDRNEDDEYECFCLQAKVNNPEEYIKRPCESMSLVADSIHWGTWLGREGYPRILVLP